MILEVEVQRRGVFGHAALRVATRSLPGQDAGKVCSRPQRLARVAGGAADAHHGGAAAVGVYPLDPQAA